MFESIILGVFIVAIVAGLAYRAHLMRKINGVAGDLVDDKRYHEALKMVLQDSNRDGYKFDRAVQYLIDNGVASADAKPNLERVVMQWRVEYELQNKN